MFLDIIHWFFMCSNNFKFQNWCLLEIWPFTFYIIKWQTNPHMVDGHVWKCDIHCKCPFNWENHNASLGFGASYFQTNDIWVSNLGGRKRPALKHGRSKLGNVKGCPPVSSILNWRVKTAVLFAAKNAQAYSYLDPPSIWNLQKQVPCGPLSCHSLKLSPH